ncbi:MAG: thioredoxin family protein [Actinomycetota bacterium]
MFLTGRDRGLLQERLYDEMAALVRVLVFSEPATSIEAQEFSGLAGRFGVYAVPKIVVNDTREFTGALSEPAFLDAVLGAPEG